jgi:hypothetical protein
MTKQTPQEKEAARFAVLKAHFAAAKDVSSFEYLLALVSIRDNFQEGENLTDEIEGWKDYHGAGECENCEALAVRFEKRDRMLCRDCM